MDHKRWSMLCNRGHAPMAVRQYARSAMAKRAELISPIIRERLGAGPADVDHAEIGQVISIECAVTFARTTTVAAAA